MATASVDHTCCICNKRIRQQSESSRLSDDKRIQAKSLQKLLCPASARAHKLCLRDVGRLNQDAAANRRPTRATPAALLQSGQAYSKSCRATPRQAKAASHKATAIFRLQHCKESLLYHGQNSRVSFSKACNSMCTADLSADAPSAPKRRRPSRWDEPLAGRLLLMCMV